MNEGLPDVSFHDAEVLRLTLDHEGPIVRVVVEAYARTPQAQQFELTFTDVSDVELRALHTQNVLFDLKTEQDDQGAWITELAPSVGVGGTIRSAGIGHAPLGGHRERWRPSGGCARPPVLLCEKAD